MESIEFGDEVFMIAVAIGHSLEGTDLVGDAFESASRDGCKSAFGNCGGESGLFSDEGRPGAIAEIGFQPRVIA